MVIGAAYLRLHLPGASSLKDKRRIVKSVVERLKSRFNLAVAEVGELDKWQLAEIGLVTVSADQAFANSVLSKAVDFVENGHWEMMLLDYQLEFLHEF